jgi:hypothetical protein
MPFNPLVIKAIKSKLYHQESGVVVRVIDPSDDERIAFFELDGANNPQTPITNDWNYRGKICDLLIFYSKKSGNKQLLCLVELEGENLEDGVEQIVQTYQLLKDKFNSRIFRQVIWGGYLCSNQLGHGQSPQVRNKRLKKRLVDELHSRACDLSKTSDIGPFLRKYCP